MALDFIDAILMAIAHDDLDTTMLMCVLIEDPNITPLACVEIIKRVKSGVVRSPDDVKIMFSELGIDPIDSNDQRNATQTMIVDSIKRIVESESKYTEDSRSMLRMLVSRAISEHCKIDSKMMRSISSQDVLQGILSRMNGAIQARLIVASSTKHDVHSNLHRSMNSRDINTLEIRVAFSSIMEVLSELKLMHQETQVRCISESRDAQHQDSLREREMVNTAIIDAIESTGDVLKVRLEELSRQFPGLSTSDLMYLALNPASVEIVQEQREQLDMDSMRSLREVNSRKSEANDVADMNGIMELYEEVSILEGCLDMVLSALDGGEQDASDDLDQDVYAEKISQLRHSLLQRIQLYGVEDLQEAQDLISELLQDKNVCKELKRELHEASENMKHGNMNHDSMREFSRKIEGFVCSKRCSKQLEKLLLEIQREFDSLLDIAEIDDPNCVQGIRDQLQIIGRGLMGISHTQDVNNTCMEMLSNIKSTRESLYNAPQDERKQRAQETVHNFISVVDKLRNAMQMGELRGSSNVSCSREARAPEKRRGGDSIPPMGMAH